MAQKAGEMGKFAAQSVLQQDKTFGPREYFEVTNQAVRHEVLSILINHGNAPKDLTLREVIIFHDNMEDIMEMDQKVYGFGGS